MSKATADRARALIERSDADQAQALIDAALPAARGADRAELLMSLSSLHRHRGQQRASLAASVEAGELFSQAGQPGRLCDALTLTAGTLRVAGDHETALSTLEHAESLARAAGDEKSRALVLRNIGVVSSLLGRHQQAQSYLDEAMQLLQLHGSADEQRNTRQSQLNGISRRLEQTLPGAVATQEIENHLQDWQALAAATSADGQTRTTLMALGNHAITLRVAGRHDDAAQALQALLPRYRDAGMLPNEGLALGELGHCHKALGDFDAARGRYHEALVLLRTAGAQDDMLAALEGLAVCEEQLGDVAAALATLKEVRAVEKQRNDDKARHALLQRELRVELARLSNKWAQQATQDSLTGLSNRRALESWIGEHWPRVERGHPLTLVLIDLDNFKRINDSLGHGIGDRVLEAVGQLLKVQCRAADLAVRYGGEEFLLALAGTPLEAAAPLAERLRGLVEAQEWSRLAPELHVTASLGVADATEALDSVGLLTLADRRLYAAKLGGRNRVVAWG